MFPVLLLMAATRDPPSSPDEPRFTFSTELKDFLTQAKSGTGQAWLDELRDAVKDGRELQNEWGEAVNLWVFSQAARLKDAPVTNQPATLPPYQPPASTSSSHFNSPSPTYGECKVKFANTAVFSGPGSRTKYLRDVQKGYVAEALGRTA